MFHRKKKRRWLILAISASLLSGGSQALAQLPSYSTRMITPVNNLSTAEDPYNSIVVTQDSEDSSITDNGASIYLGIGNNGLGKQPFNVYVTTPASGDYVVYVSNDGSVNSGRIMAAGVGSMSESALTNIFGPLTVQVSAIGAGTGKSEAQAIGIGAISGTLNTETVHLSVMAQGGRASAENDSAKASANGILNGNVENTAPLPTTVIGTTDGSNVITVSAFGGTSEGTNINVRGKAFGVENYGNLTFKGLTTIRAEARGGDLGSGGSFTAGTATAEAFGLYNSGSEANLTTGDLVLDLIKGTGSAGYHTTGFAAGIYNANGSITTGRLKANTILAQGGTAGEYGAAEALAFGVLNSNGSVTTNGGEFLGIVALGGTAGANGNANGTAYLLENGDQDNFTARGRLTGLVTATGGTGPYANAGAYGLDNYGTVNGTSFDLEVRANGQKAEYEANAEARGINNYRKMAFLDGENKVNVTAVGGSGTQKGAQVFATAYGIFNNQNLTLGGPTAFSVQALGGSLASEVESGSAGIATADAYGLYNQNQEVTADALNFDLVQAQGGTADKGLARAFGIYNEKAPQTIKAKTIRMSNILAVGGTGSGDQYAEAYGIKNKSSTLETTDPAGANSLRVRARGGTSTATGNNVSAEAFGLSNLDWGSASLKGSWQVDVEAQGGNALANAKPQYATVDAIGIFNEGTNGITIDGPVTITTSALGGVSASDASEVNTVGIYSSQGTVQLLQAATITASVSPVSGSPFAAGSLYADNGRINLGTDGETSLGKVIKLQGDVEAKNESGVINVTLDQANSYLQGNVRETDGGRVNLVVGGGAVWRPVYDNRYGSFYDSKVPDTYSQDYKVQDNAIKNLTLNEGGLVDLTWDNNLRSPSEKARTLTISRLDGNNGIFKLNSDLANNIADKLSIAGAAMDTTKEYIQVSYDPYLKTEKLTAGKMLAGKAEVVSLAPDNITFAGKQGEYNLYQYTPTVVKEADGKWYLTSIKIDNVVNGGGDTGGDTGGGTGGGTGGDTGGGTGGDTGGGTGGVVTTVTGPVRTIGQSGLALHNLWLKETNNLDKRLGDLRAGQTESAGVWARYNRGKVERGQSSLKYNLFQAGIDKDSQGENETTYRGVAVSHAKGDGSYEIGSGDLSETTLSLYQTGVRKGGQYYDVILKAGRYADEYNLVSSGGNSARGDYHTWGYSVSGEYGVRKQLGKGGYVEPQAELILGRIQGVDYTTSTNLKARMDAQNKAVARLGLAFGQEFKGGSLYGKASFYHDFGGGLQVRAADGSNSIGYTETLARNWGELSLGGTAKVGKNMMLYGELSKYIGQLSSNLQVILGARWSF